MAAPARPGWKSSSITDGRQRGDPLWRGVRRRQAAKWIERGHCHRFKATQVSREHGEVAVRGGGRNGDVREARRKSGSTHVIDRCAGDAGCGHVEGEHSVRVEVEHQLEPVFNARGPGVGAGASHLGDPAANLSDGDRREEESV